MIRVVIIILPVPALTEIADFFAPLGQGIDAYLESVITAIFVFGRHSREARSRCLKQRESIVFEVLWIPRSSLPAGRQVGNRY